MGRVGFVALMVLVFNQIEGNKRRRKQGLRSEKRKECKWRKRKLERMEGERRFSSK